MTKRDLLTQTLVELADTLVDEFDVVELLTLLADRCCETFDVSDAGIMLVAPIGDDLRVMASSSTTMHDLELYELQSSEGPCLDCYRSGKPVTNEDLDTALELWPKFTVAARAAGFRSVLALPMRLRGWTVGALNLFRSEAGPISNEDVLGAQACADVATIAILQHQAAVDARHVNDQLNSALNSRVIIEQAKGMLAERETIDVDEAFAWLRSYARRHNLRLVDSARDFVEGNLAGIEPPPS